MTKSERVTLTIRNEVWRELTQLKLDLDVKSISVLIKILIDDHKKHGGKK